MPGLLGATVVVVELDVELEEDDELVVEDVVDGGGEGVDVVVLEIVVLGDGSIPYVLNA